MARNASRLSVRAELVEMGGDACERGYREEKHEPQYIRKPLCQGGLDIVAESREVPSYARFAHKGRQWEVPTVAERRRVPVL